MTTVGVNLNNDLLLLALKEAAADGIPLDQLLMETVRDSLISRDIADADYARAIIDAVRETDTLTKGNKFMLSHVCRFDALPQNVNTSQLGKMYRKAIEECGSAVFVEQQDVGALYRKL